MASFCNPGYFIGFNNTNAGKILTSNFQDSPDDIHSLIQFEILLVGFYLTLCNQAYDTENKTTLSKIAIIEIEGKVS